MRRASLLFIVTSLALAMPAIAAEPEKSPPFATWSVPSASASASTAALPSSSSSATAAPPSVAPATPSSVPTSNGRGVVVLAQDGSTDAAWRLALDVYKSSLRPNAMTEPQARALAGEAPPNAGPRELRDLYETRAAIHGDDAPSRRLLASIASTLGVAAIVVVAKDGSGTTFARVFVASSGSFDAARYTEDAQSPDPWQPAAASIERTYRPVDATPITSSTSTSADPSTTPGNPAAVRATPSKEPAEPQEPKPFYKSPWFWGALGAAVFGGGAVYLATQDGGSGNNLHVQMKVPR